MGRVCVLAAVLGVAAVGSVPQADARPGARLKIGLPKTMFRDAPSGLIDVAAAPFRDLFKKQAGLDGDVEVLDDCDKLAAAMRDQKVDVGVFSGFEFAWVRGRYPDVVPLVVVIPQGRKLQANLVVHKDAKATKPADLGGDCVAVPVGSKPHCHLFLERLRADLPEGKCGPAKTEPKGPSDVLDGVACGDLTAGLVDVAALAAYQNSKPGAFRALRVLAESELFPPGVIAYRKGSVDTPTATRIRSGLTGAGDAAQGRAFLMLLKLKGFEDVPADFEAEMKRIYKAYPPPK